LQAHLKAAQANAKPKLLKELAKPTQKKNCFIEFPNALKEIKIRHHTARQTQQTSA
jgi:NifU-like protein involved in Fe-S cluster formation